MLDRLSCEDSLVFTSLSVASLGGQVSVLLVGEGVDQVTDTESGTDVGDLARHATSSVENGIVERTSKRLLLVRRENVRNNALFNKKNSISTLVFLLLS